MKRIISRDFGVTTQIVTEDGVAHIQRIEDVAPILDRNKKRQNDPEYQRKGIKEGWHHVAEIPVTLIAQWIHEGKLKNAMLDSQADKDFLKSILEDPDYRDLRTYSKTKVYF